jgi:hypothetical protein
MEIKSLTEKLQKFGFYTNTKILHFYLEEKQIRSVSFFEPFLVFTSFLAILRAKILK